jgi:hypothetical protein
LIVYVDIIASFFACNGPFYFFTIALNFINCDLLNCVNSNCDLASLHHFLHVTVLLTFLQ